MKKIINPKTIPFIVVASCIIGMLLRIWTQGGGPDIFELYPRMPLAWTVLGLFSVVVAAAIMVAVRPLTVNGSYAENYPKSILGFIGYLLAGGGVLFSAYEQMTGPVMGVTDTIAVYCGFAGGAVMLALSAFRLLGKKPPFGLHSVVCLYLAVRLFNRCQMWSNESQLVEVIMPFLASLVLMLAFYHRNCFDVGMGKRSACLLLTLLGTYLCVVAILSFQEVIFYATWALWLMTNLCSLQPLEQGAAPGEDLEAPENMSAEEMKSWLEDEKQ